MDDLSYVLLLAPAVLYVWWAVKHSWLAALSETYRDEGNEFGLAERVVVTLTIFAAFGVAAFGVVSLVR